MHSSKMLPLANAHVPELALTIALTGHRDLSGCDTSALRTVIATILQDTQASLDARRSAPLDGVGPPILRFATALAEGADLLATEAAAGVQGWSCEAILPFAAADYARTFADPAAAQRMQALAEKLPCLQLADWTWPDHAETGPVPEPADADRRSARWRERRYTLIGQMLVRRADLVIAVWRGGPANGRGGTAEVVAEARRSGVPVVWINPVDLGERSILPDTQDALPDVIDDPQGNSYEGRHRAIDMAIGHVLLGELERSFETESPITDYVTGQDLSQWREPGSGQVVFGTHAFLYAWLLWFVQKDKTLKRWPFMRMRPIGPGPGQALNWWRKLTPWPRFLAIKLESWSGAKTIQAARPDAMLPSDKHRASELGARISAVTTVDGSLSPFFERADRIASRLSHHYRSGYIAIFALAAVAVVLAGLWLFAPYLKPAWVMLELVCILTVIVLWAKLSDQPQLLLAGNKTHQRYLDARFLAESLRGSQPLSWIGFSGRRLISPQEQLQVAKADRSEAMWTPSFTNAITALASLPTGRMDPPRLATLTLALINIIEDQKEYHEKNHRRLKQLHARLDSMGIGAVLTAALFSVIYLGLVIWSTCTAGRGCAGVLEVASSHHVSMHNAIHLSGVAAAFFGSIGPALAAAMAGIRYHGDFERFSERSHETSTGLAGLSERGWRLWRRAAPCASSPCPGIPLFEELFTLMLDVQSLLDEDLQDWRFAYKARPVPLP